MSCCLIAAQRQIATLHGFQSLQLISSSSWGILSSISPKTTPPSSVACSYATSPVQPSIRLGNSTRSFAPADNRRKRFNVPQETRPKGYDYEWVVVKGGQRMLARAPKGTKRWHIWTSYEDLATQQLQQRRRAQQGHAAPWLVDIGGQHP